MSDWKKGAWLTGAFVFIYYLPLGDPRVSSAVLEAFRLLQWYAINHTLACVIPAMFIAGAIATFLSADSVTRYLGPDSRRATAYGVASVAGIFLAVCSCSVLPMFAGIYSMGAGLGPASAFLYSGPAINVMAISLSARVLGVEIGAARAIGAIVFAVVIGLMMATLFRREEANRSGILAQLPETGGRARPLWKTAAFFAAMILFLVFSDWYNTNDVRITLKSGSTFIANVRFSTRDAVDIQEYGEGGLSPEVRRLARADIAAIEPLPSFSQSIHAVKWYLAGGMGLLIVIMAGSWFSRKEFGQWMRATWDFGLLIIPLLFVGVLATGFVGSLLPGKTVAGLVGGEGAAANFVASLLGTIWYFATLTEVPIVEMLRKLGMGKGPALALLLAGPALSLPSILVIHKVIGTRRTAAFCLMVVVFSTLAGWMFGNLL